MNSLTCALFGAVQDDHVASVESAVCDEFDMIPAARSFVELPAGSYDDHRNQYNSELLLRTLLALKPAPGDRILGITEADLFIPMMTFVFGQAQLNGGVAVVSAARLRQEFYGFAPQPMVTVQRLVVEAVHEMGHTFGLTHCLDRTCPMSLSTSLRTLDVKGNLLCAACRVMLGEQIRIFQSQS